MRISIVGAGVAGAYLLNRLPAGNDVECFEMRPEDKWYTVCAWGTSEPYISDLVKKTGLNFEDYVLHRGKRMIVEADGSSIEIKLKGLVTYDKHKLTHDMLKGHKIHWGKQVKSADGDLGDFDLVIDSTGLQRILLPKLEKDVVIPSVEYQVRSREFPYDDFYIKPYRGLTGYLWFFPLGDGIGHIGAGDFRGKYRGELEEFLTKYKCEVIRKIGRPVRVLPPAYCQPFDSGKVVGVGECLHPLTEVITHESLKPISEIEVGDKVLTHKGTFKAVTKKFVRDSDGELVAIKTALSPYEELVTPDHPILGMRKYRAWDKIVEFIPAAQCTTETYVALPNPSTWWSPRNHSVIESSFNYPTPNLLRLAGYYVSEGSVVLPSLRSRAYAVEFSFGSTESAYIEDVRQLLQEVWAEPYLYERNGCTRVILKRKNPTLWFSSEFGRYSHTKRIPYNFSMLDYEHTEQLFKGLIFGDGTWDNRRIRYGTVSPELAWQIRWLLTKFGVVASTNSRLQTPTFRGKVYKGKMLYELTWAGGQSERLRRSLGLDGRRSGNRTWSGALCASDYTFFPVTQVRRVPYHGPVYNLEVDANNTYATKSFVGHNCIGSVYPLLGEGIIPSMQCVEAFVETFPDRQAYAREVLKRFAVYTKVFKFVKAKLDGSFSVVSQFPNLLSIYFHMKGNERRYGLEVKLRDFMKIVRV
jgi:flavin-dependent dehydrogenase